MKLALLGAGMGFGVALAVVIGERMPNEAVAIVIGVVTGGMVSVPITMVMFSLANKEARIKASLLQPRQPESALFAAQPNNVIVIDPSKLVSSPKGGLVQTGVMRTMPDELL